MLIFDVVFDVHAKDADDDGEARQAQRRGGQDELEFDELVTLGIEFDFDQILQVIDVLVQTVERAVGGIDVGKVRFE